MADELIAALADVVARMVQPITARLAAQDAELAVLRPLAARLDAHEGRWHEFVTKDLGVLRERVAVVETRAPIPGPPGKDGRDGLSLKDFDLSYDGHRNMSVTLRNADAAETRSVKLAGVLVHHNVWTPGEYEAGDLVTWSGGSWHCSAERTIAKPGESPVWVLIVKRGRDGKDARP